VVKIVSGIFRPDGLEHAEAVQARHAHVQEQQVRALLDEDDRLLATARFADHLDVRRAARCSRTPSRASGSSSTMMHGSAP
jgi:hypothetical protein